MHQRLQPSGEDLFANLAEAKDYVDGKVNSSIFGTDGKLIKSFSDVGGWACCPKCR